MKSKTSFGHFAKLWDEKVGNTGVVSSQESVQAIQKLLGSAKHKRMYEIACGNGFLARIFVRAGAAKVYASDIAPELIAIAKEKYPTKGIMYSTQEGTSTHGLPKNYFDAVIIHQGIFYIKNIGRLVQAVRSLLKKGGVFIFTIPHALFPVLRKAVGMKTSMGEPINIQKLSERYIKNYETVITKQWGKNKKTVSYLSYHRPLEYYIHICAKYGMLITGIKEPASKTRVQGKIKQSSIPSSFIVRTIKR